MIDVDDVLARAREARRQKIAYHLGAGGRRPDATTPADDHGRCDCSGLTAWLHRLDRRQVVDGRVVWLSTAGIMEDAAKARRFYEPVERPELGALLVYAADPQVSRGYGHVAAVTGGVPAEWDPSSPPAWEGLLVTHCHGPAGRCPAVEETSARLWGRLWGKRRGTMILRPVG